MGVRTSTNISVAQISVAQAEMQTCRGNFNLQSWLWLRTLFGATF
jgi:hypothetical protein